MEAARKLYETSYDDRLETAVSAKAYLDYIDQKKEKSDEVIKSRKKTGRLCSLIGLLSSISYCAIILALLLIPLIKETELHKLKAAESDYKNEKRFLEEEITKVESQLYDSIVLANIKKVAIEELGLISRDDAKKISIQAEKYYTLEDARNNYYNKANQWTSQNDFD